MPDPLECSSSNLPENAATEGDNIGRDGLTKAMADLKLDSSIRPKDTVVMHPYRLRIDYSGMQGLTTLTGTPKLPAQTCQAEYDPIPSEQGGGTGIGGYPGFMFGRTYHGGSTPTFPARITFVECITAPDAVKRTLLLGLDVSQGKHLVGGKWLAGDSFGICAPNRDEMVTAVLGRILGSEYPSLARRPMRLRPTSEGVQLPGHLTQLVGATTTLFELYKWVVDLTSSGGINKQVVRYLAEKCCDKPDRDRLLYICSRQGLKAWTSLRAQRPRLLDILGEFLSCAPDPVFLAELLTPLSPRAYSIAATPVADGPERWTFAFNVVESQFEVGDSFSRNEDEEGRIGETVDPQEADRHQGLCTTWLDALTDRVQAGSRRDDLDAVIPVYLRSRLNDFTLPLLREQRRPVIMVGPGTGVTPFIGFLSQRERERDAVGGADEYPETILFFGCRHRDRDFLFKTELEAWASAGVLTTLNVSFSRDETGQGGGEGAHTKYVQDEIKRQGARIS
ncbi:hypothetical protein EV182_003970, partial [Spiromyces aspiralis]